MSTSRAQQGDAASIKDSKADDVALDTRDVDVESLPQDHIKSEVAAKAAENNEATADYSGFSQKSDPKEIRLVRKLDCYIMISLWAMVSGASEGGRGWSGAEKRPVRARAARATLWRDGFDQKRMIPHPISRPRISFHLGRLYQ